MKSIAGSLKSLLNLDNSTPAELLLGCVKLTYFHVQKYNSALIGGNIALIGNNSAFYQSIHMHLIRNNIGEKFIS